MKETDRKDVSVNNTPEFKTYLEALCRLASVYVPRIRVQFAEKAVEKFRDETIRKLVLAYGEEMKKLDDDRLRDFTWMAEGKATVSSNLEDSCVNKVHSYHDAIELLFEIN